jgi:hypothetical protein
VVTVDTSKVAGPAWKNATAAAMKELNSLFASKNVNISLKTGESPVIFVAVSSGKHSFPVDGQEQSGTLRTDILHGKTNGIDRQTRNDISREQAFIFLPQNPRVTPTNPKSREVGEKVMRVMVAHEFLHALGLETHDAGFEGLLAGSWTLNEGRKAADDTVSPFGSTAKLPPLGLSAKTWARLKAVW